MSVHGLIPVSGASQRIAHFFPRNNDIFYLSSNCVNISRNQLIKLHDQLKEKIAELENEINKILSDKTYYETVKTQNNEISEYFKNNLTALFKEYERAVKKNVYSPFIDCDKIKYHQERHTKRLLQKFNDFLELETDNNLLYSSYEIVNDLTRVQIIKQDELNKLDEIRSQAFFILNIFTHNYESTNLFEERIRNFVRDINNNKIFKKYFFDYYINIKSNELQLNKKVIVGQVKKMVGKYKKIMKLRKQNFSVNKYMDLIQNMKQNQIEIKGLYNDYTKMVRDVKEEVKKYKTGYFVNYTEGYKIKPFQEHIHKKEIDEVEKMFYGDDFADIEQFLECETYAEYFTIPDADQFHKSRNLESKYHNALLLIRIVEKEKNELDKLSEEVDVDSVNFIDNEEVEEVDENEEEEEDNVIEHGVTKETEEDVKNMIIEHIDNYINDNEIEEPTFTFKPFSPSPDRIFLIIDFEGEANQIIPKMEYEDQYYLKEMDNVGYLSTFLEKIRNMYE